MQASEKGLQTAIVNERCQGISIFQGSDQQIADFVLQGEAGLGLRLSVEAMRAAGILQRDAAYYVDSLDRIEAACSATSRERMLKLADIASDVEQNRHFAATADKKRLNIISCMLLPGSIRAFQGDLWTQTLGEVTLASLAVERHRQEFGHLPTDLDALVPRYLPKVPEDPYTGHPISFHLLPKGYVVYAPGISSPNSATSRLMHTLQPEPDDIVCKVER